MSKEHLCEECDKWIPDKDYHQHCNDHYIEGRFDKDMALYDDQAKRDNQREQDDYNRSAERYLR